MSRASRPAARIPGHALDAIRSRTDIIALAIGYGLELRQRGSAWWSRCPMHDERTPSFRLDAERQRWRCFGACHRGGDAIDLAMILAGLSWREAVAELAGRCGVELEGAPLPRQGQRQRSYTACRRPKPEVKRPSVAEVRALWDTAAPVISMAEVYGGGAVARWLEGRGLDPLAVELEDLARILPRPHRVHPWPRWACYGEPWPLAGYVLGFPVYNSRGALAGLRAGRIDGRSPKRVSPAGVDISGLTLANEAGRRVLDVGAEGEPATLLIAEGEPDHLTAALRWDLPVLGICSGSWTAEIAARIPSGSTILIGVDRDDAGSKYAEVLEETLGSRCRLRRLKGTL